VHCGKPGAAQVTHRQVGVVGQDPQPPGLLEVVIDVPEEGESVIGLGTGLDFERGLQVARGSVEVASTHRLPTGDDEAVSRGRPHELMIGPPSLLRRPAEPFDLGAEQPSVAVREVAQPFGSAFDLIRALHDSEDDLAALAVFRNRLVGV
jgi:hypothetical protein